MRIGYSSFVGVNTVCILDSEDKTGLLKRKQKPSPFRVRTLIFLFLVSILNNDVLSLIKKAEATSFQILSVTILLVMSLTKPFYICFWRTYFPSDRQLKICITLEVYEIWRFANNFQLLFQKSEHNKYQWSLPIKETLEMHKYYYTFDY